MTAPPPVIVREAPKETGTSDASTGRSAMRKASLRIIPLLALGYGAAYMDRVNISFAGLQMNRDLHFSATIYGFGAGLFFLSYAACEIPSNLLLYRFGARRWLARIMFTWGLIAMATLFVRTPWQFYTARFLLGVCEAGFFPGVIFYLMHWFPAEVRARAISRFYISLPISGVVMGLIAGVLLNLNGSLGLAGWQWLFLVEGLPPVMLGIAFFFLLPDTPAHAKWLTEAERSWLLHHAGEGVSAASHDAKSVARAIFDPRVWQIGIFEMLMLASCYGYVFVLPLFVEHSTHLSVTNVGFIVAGLNLLGVPAMLLGASHSDRAQKSLADRCRHIIPWCIVLAIALPLCGLFTTPAVVLSALCLISISYYAIQGPFWSLPTSLFAGRSSAAAIAAVNTIGIIGGFIGPYYMGFAKDLTGSYRIGLMTLSLPWLAGTGIMLHLFRKSLRLSAAQP